MNHYVGLDVSVKETSLCIVDEAGTICRELKVISHPDDLIEVLSNPSWHLVRIGPEAGPLSQWLFEGLTSVGLPAGISTLLGHGYTVAVIGADRRRRVRATSTRNCTSP